MSDPYKVLGIERDATDEEIKKAYRNLSKKYHPDANINNPNKDKAEEMFKLVQEAYQQIIYERQHPYASTGQGFNGSAGSSSYSGGGYSGSTGQGYNGQFYTNWEDFFNDFFAGAYGGQYQHNYNPGMSSDYVRYMNAAASYIQNRRYSEALNVLASVEDHSALWYYYSAIANAGLGNHAQALEHATIAAEMEPNNYSYQNLVTQLSRGSWNYQQRENTYVRTYDSGQWCIRLCILNAFINLCCGRGFFCC